jgi:hypothetical protein
MLEGDASVGGSPQQVRHKSSVTRASLQELANEHRENLHCHVQSMGHVYEYIDGIVFNPIRGFARKNLLGGYGAMDRAMPPSKLLPSKR